MFFGGLTIAINVFSMVFHFSTIAFNGFRWFRTIGRTMRWFRWIVVVQFRRSRAPASSRSHTIIPKLSITQVSFHHFAVILTPSRPSGAISRTRSHPSLQSHFLIPKSTSSSQSVVPSSAIVGESDFVSGILILEIIFPNFQFFSLIFQSIFPNFQYFSKFFPLFFCQVSLLFILTFKSIFPNFQYFSLFFKVFFLIFSIFPNFQYFS